MSKLNIAIAAIIAWFALGSAQAHAGWIGWNWPTSHFAGTFTRDPANRNFIRVQTTQPSSPTLLLFLPGTGSDNVGDYTDFLNAAASHGYYVIGLDYRHNHHQPDMTGCWSGADRDYYDEQVNGTEQGFWAKDATLDFYPEMNSVNYRLRELLANMTNTQPAGVAFNWNMFWDSANNQPMWSKIVVAGHSQGGATVSWIARTEQSLKGAIVFDGLYDNLDRGQPSAGAPNNIADFVPTNRYPGEPTNPNAPNNCNGAEADVAPAWVTSGPWSQRILLVTAQKSSVYDGSWPGHHLEKTARSAGKQTEVLVNGAAPSAITFGWYTIQNVSGLYEVVADEPTCTTPSGALHYHGEGVVNGCYPSWVPTLWDKLLERAKTLDTNPVNQ